ncbi:HalOD1 output domain-containing protein [Halovenus marina]|uniref:HalOD1 output domain-containing protein n=1 Tax=Halovenus marina TaxID=3396621 RepID=UPI003F57AB82
MEKRDLSLLERIIGHIADVEGVEPEDLEMSLHNHIDTDAIQALAEQENNSWELQFETPNHVVTVLENNSISVE